MIAGIDEFVQAYKDVIQGHIDIYSNEAQVLRKWGEVDFDTTAILRDLDSSKILLAKGMVQKAYDTIKAYHRTYKIYLKTRGDYYRMGTMERKKDMLILETIVNNVQRAYEQLNTVSEEG